MEDENGFFLTPEYLDIQRQLEANRSLMDSLYSTSRSLIDPLMAQNQALFSEQGYANLRRELEPALRKQLDEMVTNSQSYQAYIRDANAYQNATNLVENARKKALETGQPQRVEFSTPDYGGTQTWLIEPPGKESGYDQIMKYHAQGISPLPARSVDDYLKGWTASANQGREYAKYAGYSELAGGQLERLGVSPFFNFPQNATYADMARAYENRIFDPFAHEIALRERDKRGAEIQRQIEEIERSYGPRIDALDPAYNELYAQIPAIRTAYYAAQNAQKAGLDPTQEVQKALQAQAQSEANKQAVNAAYEQQQQQAIANMLQSGVIPANPILTAPEVTAPQVAAPTVPQYSFLSAQPAQVQAPAVQAPVQTPAQVAPAQTPVAQTPAVQAPLAAQPTTTAAVAQPVTQPTTQAPVAQAQPSFLGGIPVGTGTQVPTTTGIPMATTPSLNPATLPELRSAGGGGTSAIDPTLRPYLELGLRAAEQQFLQNVPQFFPGQTYVSPSQQTLDALAAQEQIARQAPATLQAAQESYMRGLGGLGATASGAFLSGNPFQQQMIQAATRPIMQQFEEQTLPGIASGFSGAGRYGSGAMERALGRATESTARAIGDVSTNIAFQDYGAERGRQQQAIIGQITAAGQAPAIYGQQFLPSQQLAQIGAAREAISALPLQEQMQRFQFAQQAPRESLSAFLSSVYGTPMARSQYAPTPETQTNRAASAFGLGALGAGIGSMIGGQTGAFGYTTPQLTAGGAALGALGGLLL